jgi:hypothetical protein
MRNDNAACCMPHSFAYNAIKNAHRALQRLDDDGLFDLCVM